MTNEDLHRIDDLEQAYPGYDRSYVPIYHESWTTYEENGWVFILERLGQLYSLEYQYSVMSDDNSVIWNPYPITDQQALDLIDEWDEQIREFERTHGGV